MELKVDYCIVGGGFSGLFLQSLLEKNSINTIVVDGENFGGQLNLYLNKKIYDIPGIKSITAQHLLQDLLNNLNHNNIISQCIINEIIEENNKKILLCNHKSIKKIICKKIIMATGKGIVHPIKINDPIISILEKHNRIFYDLNNNIVNKNIAILGGGDSAIDALESLSHNNKCHLIHRRSIMTSMEGKLSLIKEKYNLYLNYNITNYIWNENNQTIILHLINNTTNEIEEINVDYIYVFYGLITDSSINPWGYQGKIMVDKTTMKPLDTSIMDYVIGDGAIYSHKRFLIHNYIEEAMIIKNHILNP